MATKYPIILVHGMLLKDFGSFKAFGRIEKILKNAGYTVYTSTNDACGTIESNARQIKAQILDIIKKEKTTKVNIIAHSKGGLDCRYMMEHLNVRKYLASVTFLCTPHKGSKIASFICSWPRFVTYPIASGMHVIYQAFLHDKHPDLLKSCHELSSDPKDAIKLLPYTERNDEVIVQSFSSSIEKFRDDLVMGIPLIVSRYFGIKITDGMVSADSSKYGKYRGNCTDISVSHSEIVDFMVRKSKRKKIYTFYRSLCKELEARGC